MQSGIIKYSNLICEWIDQCYHPVPAPHPPGFQPGVAHGTQLNASVARGDTKSDQVDQAHETET